jgi:TPR repeat protein
MSTPISQGSKLTGLELYAPRRADVQSEPIGVALPQTSAPASASEEMPVQDEPNNRDLIDEEQLEAVHARLEAAIQEAIDNAGFANREESADDVPQLPPAPQLRPRDKFACFALPTAEVPRRNHADPEVESWRRSRLNPVAVPEPVDAHQRSAPTWLLRYALMIGGAAAVAYAIAVMPSIQGLRDALPQDAGNDSAATIAIETKAEPEPSSRLIAEDQRAIANEPMPLEVSVDNAVQNASLRLAGLAAGTHLSAGSQVSDSSWQVPLDRLKNVYLYAPTDFVGVMNSALDLLGPDKRLIDRREVRFEWLAKKESRPEPSSSIWPANAAPVQSLNGDVASSLMKRGQDFLGTGDIAAARILFKRLADAGIADGAFAMARTYDPRYLTEHKVIGVVGDESKARVFYQQAAQLGSVEAAHMLAQTVSK